MSISEACFAFFIYKSSRPSPSPFFKFSSTFQAFQPSRSLKASSKTPSRPFNPRFNQLVYYPLSFSLKSNDPPHECIVLYFYRYLDSWYYTLSSETFEQQSRYLFLARHCFYISPLPSPLHHYSLAPATYFFFLQPSAFLCIHLKATLLHPIFFFFGLHLHIQPDLVLSISSAFGL